MRISCLVMEWMLQVVDEIDDALGIIRFRWLGVHARFSAFARSLGSGR